MVALCSKGHHHDSGMEIKEEKLRLLRLVQGTRFWLSVAVELEKQPEQWNAQAELKLRHPKNCTSAVGDKRRVEGNKKKKIEIKSTHLSQAMAR